ncbi:zinc finger domain-containing protein [Streptomyces sp. NPDC002671]
MEPDTACCTRCSAPIHGSWRLGRTLDLTNPNLCGQPRKDGEPCRWDTSREPCRAHPSPEALKRRQAEEQAAQERRKRAEEERRHETERRRRNIIMILSVRCPHCTAPAGRLCQSPKGDTVRSLHQARRKLAGVDGPKAFAIEAANFYTPTVPEPPLDGDLRELLGDPLEDHTEQATRRYLAEQQHTAARKMLAARREMWLAEADRTAEITAQPCPTCNAEQSTPCERTARWHNPFHEARVDIAMTAAANPAE